MGTRRVAARSTPRFAALPLRLPSDGEQLIRWSGIIDEHAPGDLELVQHAGISTTVPGLYYVGLPFQRSFASATIRGVGGDAEHVVRMLRRQWQPPARACCMLPGRRARGAAVLSIGASA
jgi:hypothetical protein